MKGIDHASTTRAMSIITQPIRRSEYSYPFDTPLFVLVPVPVADEVDIEDSVAEASVQPSLLQT